MPVGQPFKVSLELIRSIEQHLLSDRRGIAKNIQGVPQIEFSCPSHDDKHQSAHWHPKKQVWKCRSCPAGGGVLNLAKALGIEADAPKRERRRPDPGQVPVRTYKYKSVKGTEHIKERYEFPDDIDPDTGKPRKTFEWRTNGQPNLAGTSMADMGLYFLEDPAARPDDPIVFVEGEKTTEAVWQRQVLACTGGWGSSQRTFNPEVWAPLRGREVWLSADNDRAGAEYMDAVAAELRGIAKKVRRVRVALPPKGDLYEFFQGGGKPEDIFTGDLDETSTEILDHDQIRVRVPTEEGVIAFTASSLARSIHALDCKLTVASETSKKRPYAGRINLLSSSARGQLRLDLSKIFDLKVNWAEIVNEATSLIDEAFANQDVSRDVYDIPDELDNDMFLFGDLLPIGQPTILFGDGGSLKSYVAELCQVALALGMPFPGQGWSHSPEPGRSLYIDFENVTERGFRRRIRRLFASYDMQVYPGMISYWPGRGIPLHNQLDALRKKVREENIRLIVVDSAAMACGGKPEDSDITIAFFNALATLNVTTIVIAHINREGDTSKPFGSAFWTNLARRTWYVKRVARGDTGEVGLFCRKVNDGPMGTAKALSVSFSGLEGPVLFEKADFSDVDRSLDRERPMGIRLTDALSQGSMTANALATRLGSKGETVLAWLKRYPDVFVEMGSTDQKPSEWGLRERHSA